MRLALAVILAVSASRVLADERVVTTLSDFDEETITAQIADVVNLKPTDCTVDIRKTIPGRGKRTLKVEIGATAANTSLGCALRFRSVTPFEQADRVAAYFCIFEGEVGITFRIRDDDGTLFETKPVRLREHGKFIRIAENLSDDSLVRLNGPNEHPKWPIHVEGFRLTTNRIGRQTVFIDDLEVEHRVGQTGIIRGEFNFDQPTRLYEPGATVNASVVLENLSPTRSLSLRVQLAWVGADGSEISSQSTAINLPSRLDETRSRQAIDFRERVRESGLYRLVAQVRDAGWGAPATFASSFAVAPSNRALPRGRAMFFGVRSNLLGEAPGDQRLEIDAARELGVQLLAAETPWSMIEPEINAFDFSAVELIVERLLDRDIAPCLVLVDPPAWLPSSLDQRLERQALVIEALASHFGRRVPLYETLRFSDDKRPVGALADQVQQRLTAAESEAVVLAAPLSVADARNVSFVSDRRNCVFETTGEQADAVQELAAFARTNDLTWNSTDRWLHYSAPLVGAGHLADAVTVLRAYVDASAARVAGLMWFELRDDSEDPTEPELMHGLLRRDFSPKATALGLASTIGMLNGLRYVGPLPGTPAEFDSALFVSGEKRQVAVLFPHPNTILPAVLAPIQGVTGAISVLDFERREVGLLGGGAALLAPSLPRPMFIVFDADRAQRDGQLGLGKPWIRVPRTVLLDKSATFTVEVDTLNADVTSYLRIMPPSDAGVESSVSTRRLTAPLGQTTSIPVELTRTGDNPIAPFTLTVRVLIDRDHVDVPVLVRPATTVRSAASADALVAANVTPVRLPMLMLGNGPSQSGDDESPTLVAGYQPTTLLIGIEAPKDALPKTAISMGLAAQGHADQIGLRIENAWSDAPTVAALAGTSDSVAKTVRVTKLKASGTRRMVAVLEVPAAALSLRQIDANTPLLIAIRVEEPSVSVILPGRTWRFGDGLDGSRSTLGYNWLVPVSD